MRIVWIGGGSLGLLFTAKFALSHIPTELIVRSEAQWKTIEQKGLELIEDGRQLTAFSAHVTKVGNPLALNPDWFALTVKQSHLNEALLQQLAHLMDSFPNAKLLCFQNGIGHEERLKQYIASDRIFTAVTTEAAYKTSANSVEHTGRGRIIFGHMSNSQLISANEANMLSSLFKKAGFEAHMSNQIKKKVWNKLIINAVINPMTALLNVKNGELLYSSEWMSVMRNIFDEAKEVANAEGGVITEQLWDELIQVCQKTSDNYSSMLQDVSSNRETEIKWINGSVVRLGEQHSIPTPINRMITSFILGLQEKREPFFS